ncbi:YycH family regulatory protein [Bacillus fonticola]|uniref:YycH family regulatory protein n=1 Tax=Bacillus fonticola TaxID=2728853 RepID=UPI001474EF0F|nr:two-component system activity regulator YycH [Bacillus fonticola]
MKRTEQMKTAVLTILVVASIVLTWNMWTYRPPYEMAESTTVQNVEISEQRKPKELLQPVEFVWHSGDLDYGTTRPGKIKEMTDMMDNWTFENLQEVSLRNEEFLEIVQGEDRIEFLFQDIIPFSVLDSLFDFEDKDLPNQEIDRVIIDFSHRNATAPNIYFADYEGFVTSRDSQPVVYGARIRQTELDEFEAFFSPKEYQPYVQYEAGDFRKLFIPKDPMTVERRTYLLDLVDVDAFKNALFNDPSFVKRNQVGTLEEFTDGSRQMEVDYSKNQIRYNNPAEESDNLYVPTGDVFEDTFSFMNDHAGWTDPYRYAEWDEFNRKVTFRMYINGRPVMSPSPVDLTEISVSWGEDEVKEYIRPAFSLAVLMPETSKKKLLSGPNILRYVEQRVREFAPSQLERLTIGYRLEKSSNNQLFTLEPTWYMLYAGAWMAITPEEDEGVLKSGLG